MHTLTQPTTDPSTSPIRRTLGRAALAVGLTLASTLGVLATTETSASAAHFSQPILNCFDRHVTVDPGVNASIFETHGYLRVYLWQWLPSGWKVIDTFERMVAPGSDVPSVTFYPGSGYYGVTVQQWSWTPQGWAGGRIASTAMPYCTF